MSVSTDIGGAHAEIFKRVMYAVWRLFALSQVAAQSA